MPTQCIRDEVVAVASRADIINAIHNNERHIPSFGLDNLSATPLAGGIGVRVNCHDSAYFYLLQDHFVKAKASRYIMHVKKSF
jgi:hypothetical protein